MSMSGYVHIREHPFMSLKAYVHEYEATVVNLAQKKTTENSSFHGLLNFSTANACMFDFMKHFVALVMHILH